jgi:hypothetical protein
MTHVWLFFSLAVAAAASPTFRIGVSATEKWGGYCEAFYRDTTASGTPDYVYCITYDAAYQAVGIEAEYGPLWLFRGRLNVAEVQFFEHRPGDPSANGGHSFVIFPTFGADLAIEPPFHWRVLPYVWGGCQLRAYGGTPDIPDPRFLYGPEVHVRLGLGVRYSITRWADALMEIQGYAHDTFRNLTPDDLMTAGGQGYYGGVGLRRIQLGVRFAVGRL